MDSENASKMKIACIYSKRYESDTKRWINEMVDAGFSYMEIAVSYLPDDQTNQDEIISYALSVGLTLNLHAPFGINNISSSDLDCRASSVANVKHSIDLAAKHGLGMVTFHPGRLSDDSESVDENWSEMIAVVSDIAEYAKEKKVFVGIENMELRPYELVYTVDDLNRFAHLAEDNPYLGVTIDFSHYATLGIGMPDLNALKLPIYDVHLSQIVDEKPHGALVDEGGTLDIAEIFRSIFDYGYDGLVVLEQWSFLKESRELAEAVLS